MMQILLRVISPRLYTQINRNAKFELYFEGRFHSHNEAIQYITEHEMTDDIIGHVSENGICTYLVGDAPITYILLDACRLSDAQQMIGQFTIV